MTKTKTNQTKNVSQFTSADLDFIYRTAKQPKNAIYSNNVIFKMLKKTPKNAIIECEPTRGLGVPNRGAVVEILTKTIIFNHDNKQLNGLKSQAGESDLNTTLLSEKTRAFFNLPKSKNIEIKFATSFSKGSPKQNNAPYTLLINQDGAYLVPSIDLDRDTTGHIKPTSAKYGIRLNNLCNALGF